MDDIVIIILTLLLTVVAAVKQSKKKREPAERKTPDFWKEILQKEILPDMPDLPEAPKPVSRMNPSPRVVPPVVPPVKYMVPTEEGTRNEIITGLIGSKIDETDDGLTKETLMEDFSLRKAFIFSEIINPKFFSIN